MPKVELHRHLEGALRLETIAAVAQQHRLALPINDHDKLRRLVQMASGDAPGVEAFLSRFGTLRGLYRSPEIIDRVTYEAVADAAAEHIAYLELRFTPAALAHAMGFPLQEVSDWVLAAAWRAGADFGIDVRLILSVNRHEDVRLAEQCVEIAADRMSSGVAGVDLAGLENRHSGGPFAAVFAQAREAGLSVTIHAGEWAGPPSVREAIEELGAMRLGHGVRAIEDPEVVALVRERGIALEVCPTSNLHTGVVASLDAHPLRALYEMGLHTTINTDDPGISDITLTGEYVVAMQHLDFTLDDIKRHVLNAAQAAFLPAPERDALVHSLRARLYPTEQAALLPG